MKNKYSLYFVLFFLSITCTSLKKNRTTNKLTQIQVVKISHDMDLPYSLINEELFDNFVIHENDLTDTILLDKTNFIFELGDILTNYTDIDIRTKVTLKYSNGKERKMFLDRFGKIMYENKFYTGSKEYLSYLRNE